MTAKNFEYKNLGTTKNYKKPQNHHQKKPNQKTHDKTQCTFFLNYKGEVGT